jgi:16S rRNA (guanine527-N7)-methyltransferase
MALLEDALTQLGLAASAAQIALLERLAAEIELWNRSVNLVHASGRDLLVRHVVDSLAALPALDELPGTRIADLGSGAGLPGLPLAILRPGRRFDLIDRSARRADFLRSACLLLGLENARVVEGDVRSLHGNYEVVVFRAFLPLGEALPLAARLTSAGGHVAAYAGRRATIEADCPRSPEGFEGARIIPLRVPFLDAERHLVVFRRG